MKIAAKSLIATLVMIFMVACDSTNDQNKSDSTTNTTVAADRQFISIGTAGVTGVYYAAGGAICRLVNKNRKAHGIRCSAESTGGSIYNINTMRTGNLDFGIVQSDWQYHAYNGTSKFADKGAFKGLRAVFANHGEPFTVVARADAEINSFTDLKGKKVNVGNPGSGTRGTMEAVMAAFGIQMSDFALASELKSSEQAAALCDGKVDAIAYVAGHPNASITEVSNTCDVVIIDVQGEPIEKMIEANPYYAASTIPAGLYKGIDKDASTMGVVALFLTSASVSEDHVYTLTKAVFDHFADYKKLHPTFATLKEEDMLTNGIAIPLHPGAIKYYQERGWK